MKEVLKNTDENNPDRRPLEQALLKTQNVITLINEGSSKQTDGLRKLLDIQNSFTEVRSRSILKYHFTLLSN
jgi:hypothetical protein